ATGTVALQSAIAALNPYLSSSANESCRSPIQTRSLAESSDRKASSRLLWFQVCRAGGGVWQSPGRSIYLQEWLRKLRPARCRRFAYPLSSAIDRARAGVVQSAARADEVTRSFAQISHRRDNHSRAAARSPRRHSFSSRRGLPVAALVILRRNVVWR